MKNRSLIHNVKASKEKRSELRKNLTPAEATLWKYLKDSQLDGHKFRRQHGIGPYIVDFFCAKSRLAVELDGARHKTEMGSECDAQRTEFFKRFNVRVIRFENRIVFENLEAVLETIRQSLNAASVEPPANCATKSRN